LWKAEVEAERSEVPRPEGCGIEAEVEVEAERKGCGIEAECGTAKGTEE
jgi:hypothetical protein